MMIPRFGERYGIVNGDEKVKINKCSSQHFKAPPRRAVFFTRRYFAGAAFFPLSRLRERVP